MNIYDKIKQLIALTIMVFILFGIMIWFRYHQSSGFATVDLIAYPLLFGGGSIVLLYFLKKFFLKEKLSEFNTGKGKWYSDVLWGLALTAVYFILLYIERNTLIKWLTFKQNTFSGCKYVIRIYLYRMKYSHIQELN